VWLSYMADIAFYGLSPGGLHLTNLLLHLANVVLLFALLARMTRRIYPSAFVAALFALHPLHVESVAWIAERKDVLSTLFWLLTTGAYVLYVERRTAVRYGLVLLSFALGLLSKPMLVTLPFTLLLLDFWPLRRLESPDAAFPWRRGLGLVAEKIPILVLAAGSCVVTYVVQHRGGAVSSFDYLPLSFRLCNAVMSYVAYLGKAVWPTGLAVLYPYPQAFPLWQVLSAFWALALASLLVLRGARRWPSLFVGWFWYLGTLVPVIGIVRIGEHAMADRFVYIPLIGIYLAIAWGVPALFPGGRIRTAALPVLALAVLLGIVPVTRAQLAHWRDGKALYTHALRVTRGNSVMHNNLGVILLREGRIDEAAAQFREALRIRPDHPKAHCNLGRILEQQGQSDLAIAEYEMALLGDPDSLTAHNNLGNIFVRQKKTEAAIRHYRVALAADPDDEHIHQNLASALADAGRPDEALLHYRIALQLVPGFVEAHYNLGVLLEALKRPDEAAASYRAALRFKPDLADAHYNLANILADQGRFAEALPRYLEAIRYKPDNAKAHNNLGNLLARAGQPDKAVACYQEALRIDPSYAPAQDNLRKVQAAIDQEK